MSTNMSTLSKWKMVISIGVRMGRYADDGAAAYLPINYGNGF